MDDLKKSNNNKEKKSGKQGNQYYTGNDKSGVLVEAPVDKYWQAQNQNNEPDKKGDVIITLWQNGFQINNEELRNYTDDSSKVFLEELQEGQVPSELKKKYPKGCLVEIENKKDKLYKPPTPPKYVSFQGQGLSLSGNQPQFQQQQQQQQQIPNFQIQLPQKPLQQPSDKTTTILVRSAAGQRIEINLPVNATVQELLSQTQKFSLMSGYPPKQLSNMQQSLEEAELLEAQVIQKLL